jgi:hypothetical protein
MGRMSADSLPPDIPLAPEDDDLLPVGALTRGRAALAAGQWLRARAAFEELLVWRGLLVAGRCHRHLRRA